MTIEFRYFFAAPNGVQLHQPDLPVFPARDDKQNAYLETVRKVDWFNALIGLLVIAGLGIVLVMLFYNKQAPRPNKIETTETQVLPRAVPIQPVQIPSQFTVLTPAPTLSVTPSELDTLDKKQAPALSPNIEKKVDFSPAPIEIDDPKPATIIKQVKKNSNAHAPHVDVKKVPAIAPTAPKNANNDKPLPLPPFVIDNAPNLAPTLEKKPKSGILKQRPAAAPSTAKEPQVEQSPVTPAPTKSEKPATVQQLF